MVPLHSPSSREPFPVRWGSRVLLPLTLALAVAAAWTRPGDLSLASLRPVYLLSIVAGLFAFWCRPRASGRGGVTAALRVLLWGSLLVWILAGTNRGLAPGRAFPYLLAFAAAALLLYAGRQSARLHPRLTLLALVCGVAFGLAAGVLRNHALVISSGFLLAAGLAAMGPAVVLLSVGNGARGWRWWFFAVSLTALFCAYWGVRAAIPGRVPASPPTARQLAQSAPLPQAVHQTLRTRLFRGVGLGALDAYLAASGDTSAGPESRSATASLFPERQANWTRGAETKSPGRSPVASREVPRVQRPYEPRGIGSLRMFALELGVLGAGLALVCVLFLVMDVVEAVWTSRRSPLSLLALGTLAIWVGILAEGAAGPGLRQPGAILLWGALAGVLWGMAAAIRDSQGAFAAGGTWESPVPRFRFQGQDTLFPSESPAGARGPMSFVVSSVRSVSESPAGARGPMPGEGNAMTPGNGWRDRSPALGERIAVVLSLAVAAGLVLVIALPRKAERLDTPDSCHAALAKDPFREETYAALARLHFDRKEVARMEIALENGRAYCPDSALLAAWEVEHARLADDPALLEAALLRAASLSPEQYPGLRNRYLEELAVILEHQKRLPAALETYCRLFQCQPDDPVSRRAVQRLAVAVFPSIPEPAGSGNDE